MIVEVYKFKQNAERNPGSACYVVLDHKHKDDRPSHNIWHCRLLYEDGTHANMYLLDGGQVEQYKKEKYEKVDHVTEAKLILAWS